MILSRASVDKKWVKEELNAALVKKINGLTKLIPVVLDDCEIPEALHSTRVDQDRRSAQLREGTGPDHPGDFRIQSQAGNRRAAGLCHQQTGGNSGIERSRLLVLQRW